MSSLVQNELFQWVDNEMEQISSGLNDGSMSIEDACHFMKCVRGKIAASSKTNEPVGGETECIALTPAPIRRQRKYRRRRLWQMRVVDLETGETHCRKKRLTKLEAAEVFGIWSARKLNSLVFFVPDWADYSIEFHVEASVTA